MRRSAARRRTSAPSNTTVTIPVTATATGNQAPNSFPGWITPTTVIGNVTAYGTTAKQIGNNAEYTKFTAKTSAASRDHEFQGWFARGRVAIRLTDAGRCFFLEHDANSGSVSIFLSEGMVEGVIDAGTSTAGQRVNGVPLFTSASTPIANYNNTSTGGAYFTFGAEGFDVYAKYNGVEFFRYTSVYHCVAGRVAITSRAGFYDVGFRDVTVTHKVPKALYSSPSSNFFDVRDFGIRPSVSDVGTIAAGSTALTVSDGSRWAIGDYIIVETGSEANYGTFSDRGGTRGVGGQWPSLVYTTVAAMNADTTQVSNMHAGVLENGRTYRWTGSAWTAVTTAATYYGWIAPRALLARVTNIVGNVLTLDTAATVAATNATVYQNCFRHYYAVFGELISRFVADLASLKTLYIPTAATINWPAGSFAWADTTSRRLELGENWVFTGAGRDLTTLFSPEGTMSIWLEFDCGGKTAFVRNVKVVGLCRLDKPFVNWYKPTTEEPQNTQGVVSLYTTIGGEITDIEGVDMGQSAAMLTFSTGAWMRRINVKHNTGFSEYFQWQVATVNCTDCGAEDIVFDFTKICPGIESFQSTGTIFRRISGRNCNVSSNSNGSWLYEEFDLYWEEDSLLLDAFPKLGNYLVDINSNASNTNGLPTTGSGTFRNYRLRQLGKISLYYSHTAVTIGFSGGTSANILGRYPEKPAATLSGYMEAPDNTAGANGNIYNSNNVMIRNDSIPDVVVDGVRAKIIGGTSKIGANNGGAIPATMTVRNCVVDFVGSGGTQSNNITNATYEAL